MGIWFYVGLHIELLSRLLQVESSINDIVTLTNILSDMGLKYKQFFPKEGK